MAARSRGIVSLASGGTVPESTGAGLSNCQRPAAADRAGPTRRPRFRDRRYSHLLILHVGFARLQSRHMKERGRRCEAQGWFCVLFAREPNSSQTHSRRGSQGLIPPDLFGESPSGASLKSFLGTASGSSQSPHVA